MAKWYIPIQADSSGGLPRSDGPAEFIAGFFFDDETGILSLSINDNITLEIRNGYIVVPDAPADTSTLEFGAVCKNPLTGKILYRDAGGLKELP